MAKYDYILFNPPLLIADVAHDIVPLARAIFDTNGDTIHEFFGQLSEYMHDASIAYVLHTNRQNVRRENPRSEAMDRFAAEARIACDTIEYLDAGYEIYGVYGLRRAS